MLMVFILHFYIIFGTNLLTGGPTQIAVFLPILDFRRKGISNGVQMEWNLRERDFLNKRDPGDLEWLSRNKGGRHEAGGRVPHPRGPLVAPPTYLSSYIYPRTPKHPGAPRKPNSTAATFCTREIPSWGLFRSSAGGGIDHGGPLHQLHGLSSDVWVVYFRPTSP